jgi:hypothetical protein
VLQESFIKSDSKPIYIKSTSGYSISEVSSFSEGFLPKKGNATSFFSHQNRLDSTKLLGLQWQGAHSKDVPEKYRVRFPGEQRLTSAHTSRHEPGSETGVKAKKNRLDSLIDAHLANLLIHLPCKLELCFDLT